jgi:hypothetical protein
MKSFSYDDAVTMFHSQQNFLKSEQAKKLHPENFAHTIISEIKPFL